MFFWLKTIKPQIILILSLVYLLNLGQLEAAWWFRQIIFAGAMVLFDVLVRRMVTVSWVWPKSAIITALLIALVADPRLGLVTWLILIILAVLPKYFIRLRSKHIFNPAVLALFITSLIYPTTISWWGISTPAQWWILLLAVGAILIYTYRRWFVSVSFLIGWFIAQMLASGSLIVAVSQFMQLYLRGDIALFALVMLVEPITSPVGKYSLVAGGFLVAVLSFLISKILPVDPLMLSLLSLNVIGRKWPRTVAITHAT